MHRFLPLAPPKRAWLHPLTPLLYIFTHIGEVPSQSAFLKAEVQLPQPFLTRDMLQSFNHFCSSPLDPVQELHVSLVLQSPELDTTLQMWPQQGHTTWLHGTAALRDGREG